jgi:hypothetical protein
MNTTLSPRVAAMLARARRTRPFSRGVELSEGAFISRD